MVQEFSFQFFTRSFDTGVRNSNKKIIIKYSIFKRKTSQFSFIHLTTVSHEFLIFLLRTSHSEGSSSTRTPARASQRSTRPLRRSLQTRIRLLRCTETFRHLFAVAKPSLHSRLNFDDLFRAGQNSDRHFSRSGIFLLQVRIDSIL